MPVGIDDEHLIRSDAALLLAIRDAHARQVLAQVFQAIDHPRGVPRLRGGHGSGAGAATMICTGHGGAAGSGILICTGPGGGAGSAADGPAGSL